MVSPIDMEPSVPCNVQADELEVAVAINRIQTITIMDVKTISYKWDALRTFAPDHEPVIGPDPKDKDFVWLAGQGGSVVVAGAASARKTAELAAGNGVPQDLLDLGITAEAISAERHCVVKEDAGSVVVGSMADLV